MREQLGITRRQLLAAAGTAGALAMAGGAEASAGKVPTAPLGKTGRRVSKLGFGGSWDIDHSVLAAGLERGVTYFDTAEEYRSGQSERAMGEFIRQNCKRDQVYVVSKTFKHHALERAMLGCLERLQMDHLDAFYVHDVRDPSILSDPGVKAEGEKMRKSGKIKLFGFSCHHEPCRVQALEMAAASGIFDVIMFRYSFRDRDDAAFQRAVDKCAKAGIGLVAMKTLAGKTNLPQPSDEFKREGLNRVQAALRFIWADDRIASIVSEMVTIDHVMENAAASQKPMTAREDALLRRFAADTSRMVCRGCEQHCTAAAGSQVAVADILRYSMYHDEYAKPSRARELYGALPEAARDLEQGDWLAGENACPHRLPLRAMLADAQAKLA